MFFNILFIIFIVHDVNAVDWKAIQSSRALPDLPSDICEVGKYYKFHCNVCECIPPGIHKCGTLSCIGDAVQTGGYADTGCVKDTSFHNWCNICDCDDGIHVSCTNKVCPKNSKIPYVNNM